MIALRLARTVPLDSLLEVTLPFVHDAQVRFPVKASSITYASFDKITLDRKRKNREKTAGPKSRGPIHWCKAFINGIPLPTPFEILRL